MAVTLQGECATDIKRRSWLQSGSVAPKPAWGFQCKPPSRMIRDSLVFVEMHVRFAVGCLPLPVRIQARTDVNVAQRRPHLSSRVWRRSSSRDKLSRWRCRYRMSSACWGLPFSAPLPKYPLHHNASNSCGRACHGKIHQCRACVIEEVVPHWIRDLVRCDCKAPPGGNFSRMTGARNVRNSIELRQVCNLTAFSIKCSNAAQQLAAI